MKHLTRLRPATSNSATRPAPKDGSREEQLMEIRASGNHQHRGSWAPTTASTLCSCRDRSEHSRHCAEGRPLGDQTEPGNDSRHPAIGRGQRIAQARTSCACGLKAKDDTRRREGCTGCSGRPSGCKFRAFRRRLRRPGTATRRSCAARQAGPSHDAFVGED